MSFERAHHPPQGQAAEADSSQQVDLSRYRRPGAGRPVASAAPVVQATRVVPPPTPQARSGWTTELTTSLTGWILGSRARPGAAAPAEPRGKTGRVVAILVIVTAAMILVGTIAAVLVGDWMTDVFG